MGQSVKEVNTQLIDVYNKWAQQIPPELLTEKYSNPYYVSIPKNWCESKNKIMIVGKEGAGSWGCGKGYCNHEKDNRKKDYNEIHWNIIDNIKEIQEYNKDNTEYQLGLILSDVDKKRLEECGFKKNSHKFWNRIREIKNSTEAAIIWNNLDKIHRIKDGCVLDKDERKQLHSTNIKILAKEIEILKPTIVLFCGWNGRKNALKEELPEKVYNDFFVKNHGKYNCNASKNLKKIYWVKENDIVYILSHHPQWETEEYEKELCNIIKDILN